MLEDKLSYDPIPGLHFCIVYIYDKAIIMHTSKFKPESIQYYAKQLKEDIPNEAYKAATYKLIPMFMHAGFVIANLCFIKAFAYHLLFVVVCSTLIGLSIACIFLFSHELTHGTIVRSQPHLYILENFFWAFSGLPPTLWKRVHNLTHHQTMNTYDDPDRKTFKSESNRINDIYNLIIYPNKRIRYSVTVGFAMMFYSIKHIVAVFYSPENKPAIVTMRPDYTPSEIRKIKYELMYILGFWASIIYFIHSWIGILVVLLAWITFSASTIIFIITQHLRNPVFINVPDPLLTTTSVIIPKWLDRLIDWHSFHVEHHIFPGINFDFYPVISQKIEEKFPDKYQRLPMLQAIRECYDQDVLIDDPLV